MKKLLIILCLLCFTLPSFATGPYKKGCNDNITYTGTTASHEYYTELVKNFDKKYPTVKVAPNVYESYEPTNAWDSEVIAPLYDFIIDENRRNNKE